MPFLFRPFLGFPEHVPKVHFGTDAGSFLAVAQLLGSIILDSFLVISIISHGIYLMVRFWFYVSFLMFMSFMVNLFVWLVGFVCHCCFMSHHLRLAIG